MAFAPVGVSRVSLFKASSLDFNGGNWVSGSSSLAPHPTDTTRLMILKSAASRKCIACSAVQESSTPTVSAETKEGKPEEKAAVSAETKEAKPESKAAVSAETKEAKPESKAAVSAKTKEAKAEAPAKAKPAAKAAVKALPQMMEEDVIPALRSTLEAQPDITDLELSFKDNRLEGSFLQKGKPYTFWAFFPDGVLTGPKGFSLSSYGSEVSTVEPFLIDEKKITPKHVVFWVEKRLAAQGIIPVWNWKE